MALDVYEETLYGQVLPLDWDNESVSGVVLLVDGEEEFVVEPDKNGKKLYDLIDRWVTAEGVIREYPNELRFQVRSYKVEDELDYMDDDNW
ncbi:hypothetical protein GM415_05245 [Pseudodesulfovibrio cashew]|uniref:Uncharacterized protein n=1 Tax=Pseudodesulfovibrio cashew TaxID=2678688 RepID=A0A6I6JHI2_9BACT|nr:hypothetical protein [Pseudodesulfovibrio cashew]QGY39547.1 hypothetical protein GM415_05245 [Pseudodesulfovibrio cashew]